MIDLRVGQASGRAECAPGLEMLQKVRGPSRITVAGDKGYARGQTNVYRGSIRDQSRFAR
jgi:hypothetical protein